MEMLITAVPKESDIPIAGKEFTIKTDSNALSFLSVLLSLIPQSNPVEVNNEDQYSDIPNLATHDNDDKKSLPFPSLIFTQSGWDNHDPYTITGEKTVSETCPLQGPSLNPQDSESEDPLGKIPSLTIEQDHQGKDPVRLKKDIDREGNNTFFVHLKDDLMDEVERFIQGTKENTTKGINLEKNTIGVSEDQRNIQSSGIRDSQTRQDKPNSSPDSNTRDFLVRLKEDINMEGNNALYVQGEDNKEESPLKDFKIDPQGTLRIEGIINRENRPDIKGIDNDRDNASMIHRSINITSTSTSTDNNIRPEIHNRESIDLTTIKSFPLDLDHRIEPDSSAIRVAVKPEGMGELDIKLVLNRGVINGYINTPETTTADLIVRSIPEIINSLIKDGINIGNFSVSLRDSSKRWRQETYEENPGAIDRTRTMNETSSIYLEGYVNIFA